MKEKVQTLDAADNRVRFDENMACDKCGRFGACELGDRKLCQECYEGCGSCCPEFGKDDLWPA